MTHIYLFIGGFFAALYGSAAGGGGLISFPLLLLAGFSTPVAIATNRFSAVILETVSTLRFYKEGKLTRRDLYFGIAIGLFAALGAIFGSYAVISLDSSTLNLTVGSLLTLITLFLLLKKPTKETAATPLTRNRKISIFAASIFLGIYGGLLGAGMGTLMTLILVGSGLQFTQSTAICRMAGVIWSGAASIVFALEGTIDWQSSVVLSLGFSIGGWIGAGIGARKGDSYIRVLLLLVIAASLIKLIVSAL